MVKILLATTAILALFSGCNDSIDSPAATELPGGFTIMDPSSGNIPYPNDILFAPNATSTNAAGDGTLNIPYEPEDGDAVVKYALNTLDGFSTTSPISVAVSSDMQSATLPGHVRLFKAVAQASAQTNFIPAVGAIAGELTFGTDFVAQAANGRIAIIPTKPLEPESTYVVVLTDGIQNDKGQELGADAVTSMINGTKALVDPQTGASTVYFDPDATTNTVTAQTLEGLRQLNQARLAALMSQPGMECGVVTESYGPAISCPHVVMSWNFTTQSIGNVAAAFAASNPSGTITVANTGLTTAAIGAYGLADVYAGALSGVPYYLGTPSAQNPTAPLTQSFVDENGSDIVSTLPAEQSSKTIPLLMSVPNASSGMSQPASGWPVVIFQHGITQNRTNLLALADAFAQAGYAAVAIDLPLHGLDTNSTGLMTNMERTFNLDFVNNTTGAAGPDGVIDASGTHYVNLAHLLVARDNVRQSTSDLITLYNSLSHVTGATIDASRITFVGHSLGTITAFGFFNSGKALEGVTLAMPGGGIAQLLSHSPAFGGEIRAGLQAAAGIEPDSAAYESFMLATQTIVDDADSINYATAVASKYRYFAIEAVGDGSEGSGDQTILNRIPTAPLSGTDPLLDLLGMSDINASANGMVPVTTNTKSRFMLGNHKSLLLPIPSMEATLEMQGQTASFVGSKAQAIVIGNSAIIAQ